MFRPPLPSTRRPATQRNGLLDDIKLPEFKNPFDDDGASQEVASALGTGISVLKLQIGLRMERRGPGSVIYDLDQLGQRVDTNTPAGLAKLTSEASLALLRRELDWACATEAPAQVGC